MSYFDDLHVKRNYALLNIALSHIATELPFINIIRYHNQALQLLLTTPIYVNEFLAHFKPRISGIQWRDLEFINIHPDLIRRCSEFFRKQCVESIIIRRMIVENTDL